MTARSIAIYGCAAVLLLSGCASQTERVLSKVRPVYVTLPNGHDPMNPSQQIPVAELVAAGAQSATSTDEGVLTFFERRAGHPLNILQLSGGGQNGAFGAGVLKGWQESGERPKFDIVTGVSAGGLLATHALLGTKADDAVLEAFFAELNADAVYTRNGLLGIAFGKSSMYDTAPLEALLEKYFTTEVIQRVAAAYDDNRRLLVSTTNLDYDQTWVWNLSLIAKLARPGHEELYRKILLASAAAPVAFPPVEIDGHLFGDGGVRSNLLVMGMSGERKPVPPLHGPGDIWVIHNGQFHTRPNAVEDSFTGIAGSAVESAMQASMGTVLGRAAFSAHLHEYRFNLLAIPFDVDVGTNSLAFDPAQMQVAFDTGHALGKRRDAWHDQVPEHGNVPAWVLKMIAFPGK